MLNIGYIALLVLGSIHKPGLFNYKGPELELFYPFFGTL